MKKNLFMKMLFSVLIITSAFCILSTMAYAGNTWEFEGELDYINFHDNKYQTIMYNPNTQNFYFSFFPDSPTPTPFSETLSYEELMEDGSEYKMVWRARRIVGTTSFDDRLVPSDGSWSKEYTTDGLTFTWSGITGCSAEIDYIKLYKRNTAAVEWVYQGEINYNSNFIDDHTYENIKWDESTSSFMLRFSPPVGTSYYFDKKLSFEELKMDGYEYKLEWRAITAYGNSYLDGRTLPTSSWSAEYTTYGLSIPWFGMSNTTLYVDYVKIYAKKTNSFDGATAYYKFDDGNTLDSTIYGNHGTASSTLPDNEPGIAGEALKIDGTNYVEIPHNDEINFDDNDFTISFWYKTDTSVINGIFINKKSYANDKYSGYRISYSAGNINAELYLDGKSIFLSASNTMLRDNNWHNVVLKYHKNEEWTLQLYQDTIRKNIAKASDRTNSALENTAQLKIGSNIYGEMDEVVFYKKALSYSEIIDLYESTPDTQLKNSLKLDLELDNCIMDKSQSNNSVSYSTGYISKYEKHNDIYKNSSIIDGQNKIVVANSPSVNYGTGDFSISCWFKTSSTKNSNTIIDKRQSVNGKEIGYHMMVYHGNGILFQMGDNIKGALNYYYTGATNLNDGKWHHVTVTADRDSTTGINIYVDGEKMHTGNATYRQNSIDNSSNLLIGAHYVSPSNNFEGSIDSIKMHNRALSYEEIKKMTGVKKKWNYIIYTAGDNDLEGYLLHELDLCERVDFEEDINIIALIDRSPEENDGYGNWSGARLLKIRKEPFSTNEDNHRLCSEVLKEYGDFNMGESKNLEDLLTFAQNNFPADRTILSLRNHGGGISGVCTDDTSGDKLRIPEIKQALNNAQSATGKKIDILSFNACLMQMFEIMYELKDNADYIVGTECIGINASFDIYSFFQQFIQNTDATSEEVLDIMENNLSTWTWSAAKTKDNNIQSSYTAFNDFTAKLLAHNNYSELETAYSNSQKVYSTGGFYNNYLDLISFATAVSNSTTNQQLRTSAQNLITELNELQYFYKGPEGYYGISIFFPYYENGWKYNKDWYKSDFGITDTTSWDEFLDKYYDL